jgi:hypothetical protein
MDAHKGGDAVLSHGRQIYSPSDGREVADWRSTGEYPFVARGKAEQRGQRLLLQVGKFIGNDPAETAFSKCFPRHAHRNMCITGHDMSLKSFLTDELERDSPPDALRKVGTGTASS